MHASGRGDANVVGALVSVVAIGRFAAGAQAAGALVVFGATVAVIAGEGVGGENATGYCIT